MSDSLALVRFPDGELRVAYYFGGADVVLPALFPAENAVAVWEAGRDAVLAQLTEAGPDRGHPDVEPVQIWTPYAGGASWEGLAVRAAARLVDGIDPYGVAKDGGLPGAEEPKEIQHGRPAWIPSDWFESSGRLPDQ